MDEDLLVLNKNNDKSDEQKIGTISPPKYDSRKSFVPGDNNRKSIPEGKMSSNNHSQNKRRTFGPR